MYSTLRPALIVATAERLQRRVGERFPDAGLNAVARELVELSRHAAEIAAWLALPNYWVRAAVAGCLALLALLFAGVLWSVDWEMTIVSSLSDLFQGLESVINDLLFLGAGIYFLARWETRIKRHRALAALHQLRSMAHIIDMHQLPKDPEQYLASVVRTPSSPQRDLTPYELARYLDYCSEMLAIIGKVAAVYVTDFDDPVTLDGVNDVEDLTSGLSRKIWQKIMILDRILRPD